MKFPLDVRCLDCGLLFCCSECRIKHENTVHGITFDCRLCRFHNITLSAEKMTEDYLNHVCESHLPLGCKKCGRQFNSKEDFQNKTDFCCVDLQRKQENNNDTVASSQGSLQITPKTSMAPPPSGTLSAHESRILEYLKLKLKDSNSEVMTSTPTNPSKVHQWTLFQKSFTSSTLSGIHSPNSEVTQSPPNEDNKTRDTNSESEIRLTIDSPENFPGTAPKGIISKVNATGLEIRDERAGQQGNNTENGAAGSPSECSNSNTTPQDSSANRKKSVTFADQVMAPKRKTAFEFLRPKRTCTPGKLRQSHVRTPRFQAIINNFEAKSTKEQMTPKLYRFANPEDSTPLNVDTNIITGRTIKFKQESPTLDAIETSPVTSQEKNTINVENNAGNRVELKPFAILSPLERDVTDTEHYKSCIESPESQIDERSTSANNKRTILPQLIARSIQETLDSALNSPDCTTEIQLSIKITKKTVAVNEKRKLLDQVKDSDNNIVTYQQKENQVEKESTTIWSRLVSGLKWVVWGEGGRWNYSPKALNKTEDPDDPNNSDAVPSASKRKRHGSYFYTESPLSKRYKLSERIRGRRPLDRVLRGGVVLPERCHSSDDTNLRQLSVFEDDNNIINQSF